VAGALGSQRGDDALAESWDGVLIASAAGQQMFMQCTAARVVFADWLRGSGLLLILGSCAVYLSFVLGAQPEVAQGEGSGCSPGEVDFSTRRSSGGFWSGFVACIFFPFSAIRGPGP